MIKLTLRGKMKSGKNNMGVTRAGVHYPKAAFKKWRTEMDGQVIKQAGNLPTLINPLLKITIDYWPGDLIVRDVPGMEDALFHLFEYSGVIDNDSKFKDVHWREHELDRDNPRAEIYIEPFSKLEP